MKGLLTILLLSIVFGCSTSEKQNLNESHQEIVVLKQDSFTINGLWVMPNYVDSILTFKSISKYRMQQPTWFAILIEINNDTLRSYGSIYDFETTIDTKSDTLHVFENNITGNWILKLNDTTKKLELINSDTKIQQKDSSLFVLEKRQDLEFVLDTLNGLEHISLGLTNYFHKHLFAGTYEIIGTNEQVTFSSNGHIKGFQDFHDYKVDNYFGTYHPYNNMDNIIFKRELPENSNEIDWELFKWEFIDDTLILTEFKWELINHRGKKFRDDVWELSEEQIKMKRK